MNDGDLQPDQVEQDQPELIDNVVPTRGYQMLPMVGLGGSAGSIPALKSFFEALPPDTGMAFVVILHLSATHDSMLAPLLQRSTPMRVVQVTETERVEANTVYVIPPGKALKTVDGHLRLSELTSDRGRHVAVDLFFRTLADTYGPHSTAIVLSGGDGDGAIGIKRIKERGGLTIAQDPGEAEHPSMPQSSIATGMVDWVLPVSQMASRLLEYHRLEQQLKLPPEDAPQVAPASTADSVTSAESALRDVLNFLRTRTGRDFSYYKRATILRRIGRRMQVNGVDDLVSYLGCLRTRPGEAGALLEDLLISVTNFFRDADCFDALQAQIPQLFRDKGQNDSVRVWVVACATGEEAYSIAMLLHEHARTLEAPPVIQVFATDLGEDAIQAARDGLYPPTIEADVSEARLRRFFLKEHHGYRVRREVRETGLFALHDVLKDSPFSRLDLVSCRNLLIYLNREAQARALDTFHFALRPGAALFLGSSEAVEEGSPLFTVIDKKCRLYHQRPVNRSGLPVPSGPGTLALVLEAQNIASQAPVIPGRGFELALLPDDRQRKLLEARGTSWGEVHFRLLERLAPPSILVDSDHDILHLSPTAGRFLQHAGGEPTKNLLRSVQPSLRIELRAALFQASSSGQSVVVPDLPVQLGGENLQVTLEVHQASEVGLNVLLVMLKTERPSDAALAMADRAVRLQADPMSSHLDRELERLKSHLRDTVEQHEASTEELKASNEELQAMNEELRSATEELETSREELQSINEELTTVNHELKARVDELANANSDMHNLMDATAIATLFLDRELRIMRYTPSAVSLFNLIPTDLGRPLANLTTLLRYAELGNDALRVLEKLVPIEREVGDGNGNWYLARLLPYRTFEDRIAGVVLTFVDISERKQAEEALRSSEERLRLVIENAREYAIFSTDVQGRVTGWNSGAERLLGYTEAEMLGRSVDEIFTPEDRGAGLPAKEMRVALKEGRAGSECFHQRKDGTRFWSSGALMSMRDAAGHVLGFVRILCDRSEARRVGQALEKSQAELVQALENNEKVRRALEAANSAKDQFLAVLSHELRTPLTPVLMSVQLLNRRDDLPSAVRDALALIHRNVRVQSRLIDDLLDLTHISRGTLEILRKPMDLHEAIQEAVEVCQADFQAREQTLVMHLNARRHKTRGDATRLQQVVWNLLKNASKFTPPGGTISVTSTQANGRFIVDVHDSGAGISPEVLPRIFDAFEQGGSEVAREFGGLGLGLAISKATVEAHGGVLRASSPGLGQGATFSIEIPLGGDDA